MTHGERKTLHALLEACDAAATGPYSAITPTLQRLGAELRRVLEVPEGAPVIDVPDVLERG